MVIKAKFHIGNTMLCSLYLMYVLVSTTYVMWVVLMFLTIVLYITPSTLGITSVLL